MLTVWKFSKNEFLLILMFIIVNLNLLKIMCCVFSFLEGMMKSIV